MKRLMILLPIVAGLMWGSVGIFVRELSAFGMDRYTLISAKTMTASILLFLAILIYRREWLKIKLKDFGLVALCGVSGILLLNLFYNEAMNRLTLSFAAVLLGLSPIFVIFLAAVLFHEKVTRKKILCTVLALSGCFFVSGIVEQSAQIHWSLVGILVGLAAALCYAWYSIFSKMTMKRGYNVFTITFYSLFIVSVLLIPFTDFGMLESYVATSPARNSCFLLMYAICTSILPYTLYSVAIGSVDAGAVALLASGGEPVAAMLFGMIFFGEEPTPLILFGMVLTIAALALLCVNFNKRKPLADADRSRTESRS